MKLGNVKVWVIIFALILIGITIFILSNSVLDFEASHNSSGAIIDSILPDGTKDVLIDDKTVEYYVRKAAHFLEYSLLGFATVLLSFAVSTLKKDKNRYLGFSLFYVLAIAVLDEHIQSLSDRSSSTFDILLDFSGALFGIALSHLILYIYRSKLRKKQDASDKPGVNE